MSNWRGVRKFVFETHIPAWANTETLATRSGVWKSMGIDTVFLVADDGRGATWPSTCAPIDSRLAPLGGNPLRSAIETLRDSGFSVVPVLNFVGIVNQANPIRPEFILSRVATPHYDIWNTKFVDWRISYIKECMDLCGADALGVDYIRSVVAQLPGQTVSKDIVSSVVQRIRESVSNSVPIYTITNSVHNLGNSQGIDPQGWYGNGFIDGICLFNYAETFPLEHLVNMPNNDLFILVANYYVENNVSVKYTPVQIERNARLVMRSKRISGIGWYNANQIAYNQVSTTKNLDKMITGDSR